MALSACVEISVSRECVQLLLQVLHLACRWARLCSRPSVCHFYQHQQQNDRPKAAAMQSRKDMLTLRSHAVASSWFFSLLSRFRNGPKPAANVLGRQSFPCVLHGQSFDGIMKVPPDTRANFQNAGCRQIPFHGNRMVVTGTLEAVRSRMIELAWYADRHPDLRSAVDGACVAAIRR